MWSAAVVLSLLALVAVNAGPTPTSLKICVPHNALEACHRMVEQGHSVGVAMGCVAARDRLDCMNILKEHKADFEAVDPEDMYIAAKLFGDKFNIFKEIRTKEEPEAEFRYEAVVVVHKDFSIKNVEGLRGLKSCHTGVGRNVGYKIPITKLTHMGVLPPLNDTTLSPRENELKALSTFFSKSCIVGKWSPDQELNKRLKQQYHNLCELCEFPDKCDYPDQNSGYEGALRCLAIGGGDVAFTKVIFVKKFFGLAYGSQPAAKSEYNSEDFAYFCPDGSKQAISGDAPCTWAARPWQGYMSADESQDQITALRVAIAKLNDLGESTHADWISKVLALNDKTLAKDNKQTYTPLDYLNKAKYVDVIERDVLEPRRTVRLCVSDEVEASKCEDLARGAYSRDIRPAISCVTKPTIAECFTGCKNNEIDVVSVDPGLAINAIRNFNLQAVLKEEYENDHKKYAVAVVKKSSSYQSLADLKTHKACFSEVGEAAGWVSPVHNLIAQRLIEETDCPYTKAVGDFFSAGVEYSRDPMKCLAGDEGDVAFTDYDNVVGHVEGGKSTDYELICADGTRKPPDQYASCNLASVPPRVLLSNKDLSPVAKDDILFAMLSAADLYNKHPEYFDLFGSYNNHPNVLFSNAAVGLETIHEDDPFGSFTKLHDNLSKCTPEKSKP